MTISNRILDTNQREVYVTAVVKIFQSILYIIETSTWMYKKKCVLVVLRS